jgi:ribose transport system substrate-binding protein
VAEWVIENHEGEGRIIELEGTTGSSPANDRKTGFDEAIAADDRFTILESRTGDFARDEGRRVMETLLQAHPGREHRLRPQRRDGDRRHPGAGGRGPRAGRGRAVVSIDGTRDALQAIIDGKMGVTVESSPFFGPLGLRDHEAPTPPARRSSPG